VAEHPIYLDTRQLAARYGINEDTARRWIRTHRVPAVRFGTGYRVRLIDLEALEANQRGDLPGPEEPRSGPGRPRMPLVPQDQDAAEAAEAPVEAVEVVEAVSPAYRPGHAFLCLCSAPGTPLHTHPEQCMSHPT
jgi:excisionase family DNA binding protein